MNQASDTPSSSPNPKSVLLDVLRECNVTDPGTLEWASAQLEARVEKLMRDKLAAAEQTEKGDQTQTPSQLAAPSSAQGSEPSRQDPSDKATAQTATGELA